MQYNTFNLNRVKTLLCKQLWVKTIDYELIMNLFAITIINRWIDKPLVYIVAYKFDQQNDGQHLTQTITMSNSLHAG